VKNKCERSMSVWPPGVERQVGLVRGTRWPTKSSVGRMLLWQEEQDEIIYGSLVAPSSRGLQWFTKKPLDFLVEPQNRGRRLDGGGAGTQVGLTAQVGRGGLTAWVATSRSFEAKDTQHNRKACVETTRACVDAHPSDGAMMRIPKMPSRGVYLTIKY
jgi:hypothetical protein